MSGDQVVVKTTVMKINRVVSYVKGMIRKEELEAFNKYLGRMEAKPMINPEYHVEMARARSQAIMAILEVE